MSDVRFRLRNAIDQARASLERERELAQAYRDMWENPQGRLVMRDILNRAGVLEEADHSCEPDERSVRAGKRLIAIHIFERMRWSNMKLMELAREQDNDRLDQIMEAV